MSQTHPGNTKVKVPMSYNNIHPDTSLLVAKTLNTGDIFKDSFYISSPSYVIYASDRFDFIKETRNMFNNNII